MHHSCIHGLESLSLTLCYFSKGKLVSFQSGPTTSSKPTHSFNTQASQKNRMEEVGKKSAEPREEKQVGSVSQEAVEELRRSQMLLKEEINGLKTQMSLIIQILLRGKDNLSPCSPQVYPAPQTPRQLVLLPHQRQQAPQYEASSSNTMIIQFQGLSLDNENAEENMVSISSLKDAQKVVESGLSIGWGQVVTLPGNNHGEGVGFSPSSANANGSNVAIKMIEETFHSSAFIHFS
ncbi:hypothetical protein QL285_021149 [Trifolium repens]|nr:hypothetical protein QL285_021149 [Trifolium repens]